MFHRERLVGVCSTRERLPPSRPAETAARLTVATSNVRAGCAWRVAEISARQRMEEKRGNSRETLGTTESKNLRRDAPGVRRETRQLARECGRAGRPATRNTLGVFIRVSWTERPSTTGHRKGSPIPPTQPAAAEQFMRPILAQKRDRAIRASRSATSDTCGE